VLLPLVILIMTIFFLDIVVVNSISDNIGIFLNYGNGTFAPRMTFETGYYSTPSSVVLGDSNNDTLEGER
jgi:hypothetical protein